MRKIALIACSNKKLATNDKVEAQNLYQGSTFLKSKNEGVKRFCCENWFILSGKAEYNLLDKDELISYYDVYLGEQSNDYKKAWAENVIRKLVQKGFDIENDEFYIFGEHSYYELLVKKLAHCVTFYIDNANGIDFDSPIVFKNGRQLSL